MSLPVQIATIFWILCNSAIFNFYQILLFVLIRPFNRSLYRRLISELIEAPWVEVMNTIFRPSKLVLSGNPPMDSKKPCIIIANHQVDADWWYIWLLARISNSAGNIKIILKHELKRIPIVGWGMSLFDFLFLHRNMKKDKVKIKDHITSFAEDDLPYWIVLFPEGTTVHTEYVEKSKKFAIQQNRPQFNRVVLPRTNGMEVLLSSISELKPDIYDMTIAFDSYTGEIPTYAMGYSRKIDTQIPSIHSLVAGKGPNAVHIHSQCYKYDDVKENIQEWLDNRWQEKEVLLDRFIKKQSLDDNVTVYPPKVSYDVLKRLWMSISIFFIFLPIVLCIFFPCKLLKLSIKRGQLFNRLFRVGHLHIHQLPVQSWSKYLVTLCARFTETIKIS